MTDPIATFHNRQHIVTTSKGFRFLWRMGLDVPEVDIEIWECSTKSPDFAKPHEGDRQFYTHTWQTGNMTLEQAVESLADSAVEVAQEALAAERGAG